MKAYNAGDAEAVVALYAKDAVIMPPGAPPARGPALRKFLVDDIAGARSDGISMVLGGATDVRVSGDMGWHSGTFSVKAKSGATVDTGKYLEVWQRSNGKWRISRDIWNSDAPAVAPPAPPK